MANTQNSQKKKQQTIVRSHNFQKLYGTNLAGGGTEYDFRFELFNEKIKMDSNKEWSYISDALIILTPKAAKRLQTILDAYIKTYEKDHGSLSDPDPIKLDEDKIE